MIFSKIASTGSYLPEKILTNADIEKIVDTTDEWIVSRSGISARHIAADDETASDMAVQAAKQALSRSNLTPDDIDLIILATATPDHMFPSTACTVQHKLQCKNAAAFDISAACSGFVYALSIADQYIRNNKAQHILVIGSETFSKVVDWSDRSTCVLFGDGAGAVVLSASDEAGIIDTHLESMGEYGDILSLANNALDIDPAPQKLNMEGREVFKLAVNSFSDLITTTLAKNNISQDSLDWLVPHQANIRIIEALARKLNLSMSQVIVTLSQQGNTSAASIPLALDAAVQDGKVKPGQLIMLAAFGGGITWGSALVRWL
jgi:3-oxoacyl-[acyl-carrier-protein] synthase-3